MTAVFFKTFFALGVVISLGWTSLADNEAQDRSKFKYGYVIAHNGGSTQGHLTSRDGNLALGRYYVNLPNGTGQKVTYFADDVGVHTGVSYSSQNGKGWSKTQMALGQKALAAFGDVSYWVRKDSPTSDSCAQMRLLTRGGRQVSPFDTVDYGWYGQKTQKNASVAVSTPTLLFGKKFLQAALNTITPKPSSLPKLNYTPVPGGFYLTHESVETSNDTTEQPNYSAGLTSRGFSSYESKYSEGVSQSKVNTQTFNPTSENVKNEIKQLHIQSTTPSIKSYTSVPQQGSVFSGARDETTQFPQNDQNVKVSTYTTGPDDLSYSKEKSIEKTSFADVDARIISEVQKHAEQIIMKDLQKSQNFQFPLGVFHPSTVTMSPIVVTSDGETGINAIIAPTTPLPEVRKLSKNLQSGTINSVKITEKNSDQALEDSGYFGVSLSPSFASSINVSQTPHQSINADPNSVSNNSTLCGFNLCEKDSQQIFSVDLTPKNKEDSDSSAQDISDGSGTNKIVQTFYPENKLHDERHYITTIDVQKAISLEMRQNEAGAIQLVQSFPFNKIKPAVETRYSPAPQPVLQTQYTPATQPIIQSQYSLAPQSVVQSQYSPAPQSVVQSQYSPAPQSVVQTQYSPAPQPGVQDVQIQFSPTPQPVVQESVTSSIPEPENRPPPRKPYILNTVSTAPGLFDVVPSQNLAVLQGLNDLSSGQYSPQVQDRLGSNRLGYENQLVVPPAPVLLTNEAAEEYRRNEELNEVSKSIQELRQQILSNIDAQHEEEQRKQNLVDEERKQYFENLRKVEALKNQNTYNVNSQSDVTQATASPVSSVESANNVELVPQNNYASVPQIQYDTATDYQETSQAQYETAPQTQSQETPQIQYETELQTQPQPTPQPAYVPPARSYQTEIKDFTHEVAVPQPSIQQIPNLSQAPQQFNAYESQTVYPVDNNIQQSAPVYSTEKINLGNYVQQVAFRPQFEVPQVEAKPKKVQQVTLLNGQINNVPLNIEADVIPQAKAPEGKALLVNRVLPFDYTRLLHVKQPIPLLQTYQVPVASEVIPQVYPVSQQLALQIPQTYKFLSYPGATLPNTQYNAVLTQTRANNKVRVQPLKPSTPDEDGHREAVRNLLAQPQYNPTYLYAGFPVNNRLQLRHIRKNQISNADQAASQSVIRKGKSLKNLRIEYGFKPPLRPSVEFSEEVKPSIYGPSVQPQ